MNPIVSVIIPAYNAEKYIAETIHSVLTQTYSDWELIIVDDGSKDNTSKIVNKFLTDNRIKYYYQENKGVSTARNKGIEISKGAYISFLDADDVWGKDNLFKKISILQINSEYDWVFSDMYNADETLKKIAIAPAGCDENILEKILLWESEVIPGPCSNIVMKKKCVEAGTMFDTNLSTTADIDFCIQTSKSFTGKRIAEPLFIYRILNNSMSKNIAVMEHDCIYTYKKASDKKIFKSFWFKQKCFSNMYLILAGSWWVNAKNKTRGLMFIAMALAAYPPNIYKLFRKFL